MSYAPPDLATPVVLTGGYTPPDLGDTVVLCQESAGLVQLSAVSASPLGISSALLEHLVPIAARGLSASPLGISSALLEHLVPISAHGLSASPLGISSALAGTARHPIVSGVVTDHLGQPCQRLVYVVSRTWPVTILDQTLSDATTGAYVLRIPSGEEVTRVVVAGEAPILLPDLVERVIPG